MKQSEEVLEALEAHQAELQSMGTADFFKDKARRSWNSYIFIFVHALHSSYARSTVTTQTHIHQVLHWQVTLGNVEEVLKVRQHSMIYMCAYVYTCARACALNPTSTKYNRKRPGRTSPRAGRRWSPSSSPPPTSAPSCPRTPRSGLNYV